MQKHPNSAEAREAEKKLASLGTNNRSTITSPDQAAIRRAAAVRSLLDTVDVLVDGPFVESLKSLGLKWRGSSNQRLIDLAATRAAGQVVEWRPPAFSLEKPSNW